MKWLKNYERVQEIHQRIIWPSIIEMDPRIYIPEVINIFVDMNIYNIND